MERRRFLAAVGTATSASLAGCGGATGRGDDYDVGMTAAAFRPYELTVSVGEEVVWENTSTRGHTVTAYADGIPDDAEYFASGGYDSEEAAREAWFDRDGALASGDTYRHTFEVPGRYEYFCVPHEQAGMTGVVVVEE